MNLGHWQTKLLIEYNNLPYGFIYIITNITTGKKYIGKKQMKSIKKMAPLKGNKNKRHKEVETDWKEYTSSSNDVNEDIKNTAKINLYSRLLDFVIVSLNLHITKQSFNLKMMYF